MVDCYKTTNPAAVATSGRPWFSPIKCSVPVIQKGDQKVCSPFPFFPPVTRLLKPRQRAPNEKFRHLRMMRVLHRHAFDLERVPRGQVSHVGRVVIGQENVSRDSFGGCKEPFMVKLVVRVKPGAGALPIGPARGVRRVDEEYGPLAPGVLPPGISRRRCSLARLPLRSLLQFRSEMLVPRA